MTHPRHDRGPEQQVDFLRKHQGKLLWMGINSSDIEIHGHGWWIVGRVDRTCGGTDYVVIRRNDPNSEWKNVALAQIARAACIEPEEKDFLREFDQGLSPRPVIDDVIAAAMKAQDDGDAGTKT